MLHGRTVSLLLMLLTILPIQLALQVHNVALGGKASQSSTYNDLGKPENAIDGSPSTKYKYGRCTHTKLEWNPWWTVDLGAEFHVFSVSITNRGDCCAWRIIGAQIKVLNSQDGSLTSSRCATVLSLGLGKTANFVCKNTQGRYVTVTIPGYRILSLCEVQVFGEKLPSSGDEEGGASGMEDADGKPV